MTFLIKILKTALFSILILHCFIYYHLTDPSLISAQKQTNVNVSQGPELNVSMI